MDDKKALDELKAYCQRVLEATRPQVVHTQKKYKGTGAERKELGYLKAIELRGEADPKITLTTQTGLLPGMPPDTPQPVGRIVGMQDGGRILQYSAMAVLDAIEAYEKQAKEGQ